MYDIQYYLDCAEMKAAEVWASTINVEPRCFEPMARDNARACARLALRLQPGETLFNRHRS